MRHNKWQAWRLASRRAAGLGGGEGLWQVMSKLLTETEIDCVREREWQTDTLSAAFCVVCPLLLKCFAVAYINQSGKTKRLPQAAEAAAVAAARAAAAGADTAWTDAKPEEPNYS